MLFPTVEFAIFFFIVFIISWQLGGKGGPGRKIFLLMASYFFYGYWDWRFTILLFTCSMGNYLFGLLLKKHENTDKKGKGILVLAAIFNLGVLGFFKYYGFFTSSLNNLFLGMGLHSQLPVLNVILPVGISFFTFQAMSYTIDVYRKEINAVTSALDILLFVSFFPQLVAGPIVRAKDFLPQLKQKPSSQNIRADRAFLLIMSGIFKKVIIANYLATLFVDKVFENPTLFSTPELLFGVYAYAVQIYCDFSAYSDIAIGVAELLGYKFPDNFNHPYRAQSVREFWRRWHISLSTWLRDYLYISLGGSRGGKLRTYRNLMFTMLLGGLWHGAAWNFILWGLLHGSWLCIERLIPKPETAKKVPVLLQILKVLLTFHFVCLCWIFFRAQSFELALEYLKSFANITVPNTLLSPFIICLVAAGLAIHFIPRSMGQRIRRIYRKIPIVIQGLLIGLFLVLMGSMSPDGVAPFIYFQF